MLDNKPLQQRKISLRQSDIPSQQRMNRVRTQSERRNALVQLTDRDGGIVANFGDLLDEVAVAACDPANAETRQGVGFAKGAGGDGV